MALTVSFTPIKKSIEKALVETKLKVINEFEVYVKQEVDDDSFEPLRELFEGFREKLNSVNVKLEEDILSLAGAKKGRGGVEKNKKAASAYNIFIREKILELKKSNPELKGQELMRMSTAAWRESRQKLDSGGGDASSGANI